MSTRKPLPIVTAKFDKIVGGGQSLATLDTGQKLFAWGVLPGELANIQVTRKKSSFMDGVVTEVLESSPDRVAPRDTAGYLSTSPWQILDLSLIHI